MQETAPLRKGDDPHGLCGTPGASSKKKKGTLTPKNQAGIMTVLNIATPGNKEKLKKLGEKRRMEDRMSTVEEESLKSSYLSSSSESSATS
jgi:hypothetical protein